MKLTHCTPFRNLVRQVGRFGPWEPRSDTESNPEHMSKRYVVLPLFYAALCWSMINKMLLKSERCVYAVASHGDSHTHKI